MAWVEKHGSGFRVPGSGFGIGCRMGLPSEPGFVSYRVAVDRAADVESDVPEVLQCKRLGHRLHGVRGIYSHVTQPMVDAMLAGLQRRWEQSGSTKLGDYYRVGSVVKISCSQNAPTTQKQPVGDDH